MGGSSGLPPRVLMSLGRMADKLKWLVSHIDGPRATNALGDGEAKATQNSEKRVSNLTRDAILYLL